MRNKFVIEYKNNVWLNGNDGAKVFTLIKDFAKVYPSKESAEVALDYYKHKFDHEDWANAKVVSSFN